MKVRADIAPPRQLEYAGLTHGGRFLVVTVLRARGGKQRPHTETYAVERDGEAVRLVKADGRTAYTVTRWNCDCRDDDIRGRERTCKHRAALAAVGLLGETVAGDETSGIHYAYCGEAHDRTPDPRADTSNPPEPRPIGRSGGGEGRGPSADLAQLGTAVAGPPPVPLARHPHPPDG